MHVVIKNNQPWGLYYRSFYGCNCCHIVISQTVCHCQSLPPLSNICKQFQDPTIRVKSRNGLHSGRLQLCPQILDQHISDLQWQRVYLRFEHLKVASLRQVVALLANIKLGWKRLPGISTLAYYRNCSHKKLCNISGRNWQLIYLY